MPKASPARGWRSTSWSPEHTISLTDDDRAEIPAWVGVSPTDIRAAEVIDRVTSVLGDHKGLVYGLDLAPRPANQIAALDEIICNAAPLTKSLQDLDSKTRALLRRGGVNARCDQARLGRRGVMMR